MSEELAITLAPDQLVPLIKAELAKGAEHYQRAGEYLRQAKAGLHHGEWLPWLERNFELSADTAQNYMALAKYRARSVFEEPPKSIRQGIEMVRAERAAEREVEAVIVPIERSKAVRRTKEPERSEEERIVEFWRGELARIEELVKDAVEGNPNYKPPRKVLDRLWEEVASKMVRNLNKLKPKGKSKKR